MLNKKVAYQHSSYRNCTYKCNLHTLQNTQSNNIIDKLICRFIVDKSACSKSTKAC